MSNKCCVISVKRCMLIIMKLHFLVLLLDDPPKMVIHILKDEHYVLLTYYIYTVYNYFVCAVIRLRVFFVSFWVLFLYNHYVCGMYVVMLSMEWPITYTVFLATFVLSLNLTKSCTPWEWCDFDVCWASLLCKWKLTDEGRNCISSVKEQMCRYEVVQLFYVERAYTILPIRQHLVAMKGCIIQFWKFVVHVQNIIYT